LWRVDLRLQRSSVIAALMTLATSARSFASMREFVPLVLRLGAELLAVPP